MRDRLWSGGIDHGALMIRGQEPGGECAATVVGQPLCIWQSNEGGHIVSEAAKRMGNPRACTWVARRQESASLQIGSRAVNIRHRLHRHEERHVIDMLREMRQRAANPATALSVLRPVERALH
jgi:hypothetical protein